MQKRFIFSTVVVVIVFMGLMFTLQNPSLAWQIAPPPSAAGYGGHPPDMGQKDTPSAPQEAVGGYGAPKPVEQGEKSSGEEVIPAGGYGAPKPVENKDSSTKKEAIPAGGYGAPAPSIELNIQPPPAAGGYGNMYGK